MAVADNQEQTSATAALINELEHEVIQKMNVYQRLNLVRDAVPYIKKDAVIQGGGGYKAVSHDAVTAAVRKHLIKVGIMIVPNETWSQVVPTGTNTKAGVPIIRYEAKYNVEFVNIDNPQDKVTVVQSAHALDQGDKAPGKATSYAVKYAMLKLFSLETGESDEGREEQKPVADKIDLYATIRLGRAIERHWKSIQAIKDGILEGKLDVAAENWFELDNDEKRSIWVAPTKGGPFTTRERDVMSSKEFREAYYGPSVEDEPVLNNSEEEQQAPEAEDK